MSEAAERLYDAITTGDAVAARSAFEAGINQHIGAAIKARQIEVLQRQIDKSVPQK